VSGLLALLRLGTEEQKGGVENEGWGLGGLRADVVGKERNGGGGRCTWVV